MATDDQTGAPGADEEDGNVEQQDFAARSVIMSNSLPGGASPVAGAVVADRDLPLEPSTDEERAADERPTEESAQRRAADRP